MALPQDETGSKTYEPEQIQSKLPTPIDAGLTPEQLAEHKIQTMHQPTVKKRLTLKEQAIVNYKRAYARSFCQNAILVMQAAAERAKRKGRS